MKSYFTIEELSKTTETQYDNRPNKAAVENLNKLIDNVLNPLREKYGNPIKVNSGYRSKEVNKAVKGAKNSDHLYGYAADITGGSIDENRKLLTFLLNNDFSFKQLIWENNGKWIHISYHEGFNRHDILYNRGNKYYELTKEQQELLTYIVS